MFSDYHVHSSFSADSKEDMTAYLDAAETYGVNEICFTEHFDYNYPSGRDWMCDVEAVFARIESIRDQYPSIQVKKGVEMGVRLDDGVMDKTVESLQPFEFDHVIASVHLVDGADPYFPDYFDGKSRQEGFSRYVETLLLCLQQTDFYTVAGHIDYPSKGCPYDDKRMRYEDAPDVLDSLFRHLIQRGKCLEINTSIMKKLDGQTTDLHIFKRYAQLGGEFVTFGSDAHSVDGLAYRFADAHAFAKEAGIRYYATFAKMQPTMHLL